MALCSQVFSSPVKRSCQYSAPPSKKICLQSMSFPKSISSSDDDESDDEECYNQDQIRAKRRTNSHVVFNLDLRLSKAMSQYSDDEEDEVRDITVANDEFIRRGSTFENHQQENLDCKLGSSPASHKLLSDNLLSNTLNSSMVNLTTKIPDADKNSRSRCFEYLVGAIDEAWARYCNQATSVEDEVYGYNTPGSMIATDDEEFDVHTDITDYSDFEVDTKIIDQPRPSISFRPRLCSTTSTKEDPSSCKYQALKDRLTKAKYYLQDLVDSDEFIDVCNFWKRWDMIKYATIELVEDDDDDEIIESTIDELENGRYFIN